MLLEFYFYLQDSLQTEIFSYKDEKKKKKASIVHVILFYINYSYNGKGTSHEVKFGFECWLHDTLPVWL